MLIKLNNKGIALPTVLGIVTFAIALVATLLTVAVSQAQIVDKSFERTEAYVNAVQSVDATIKIIVRDQNLDPAYLAELEAYMGVSIEVYSTTVYTITSMVSSTRSITSYLTGSASAVNTYEEIFDNTGEEPGFELSPLVTPSSLLSAYLPEFFETNFPWLTFETDFTSINDFVDYMKPLAQAGQGYGYYDDSDLETQWDPTVWWHWFVNGNVTIPNNKNLTVPDNRLLIIDGDLTMNRGSTLTGNIVVNGTFKINAKKNNYQNLYGTVYASDNVTIGNDTSLGTISRPSFVFSEKDVTLGARITGYGYFLSRNLTSSQRTTTITGGVYVSGNLSTRNSIEPNGFLDIELFYSYAIPSTISIEGDGGSGGSGIFKFTTPKLN